MHLPFRPFPEPNESLPGYSVRLTSWYGYKSPDAFARQNFGYSLPPLLPDQSVTIDKWIRSLEISINVEAFTLSGHFSALRSRHQCDDARRIVADPIISSPRICEHCLAESGYHRFDWQIAHLIVCEQHSAPILDQCPSCDSPLKWNENLLSGCGSCGYKWGSRTNQLTEDIEAYKHAQKAIVDLDALYRAYLHSAFTFGHTVWQKVKFPYDSQRHFRLMQSAYRLVCDYRYNKAFSETVKICGDKSRLGKTVDDIRKRRISSLFNPIAAQRITFDKGDDPHLFDWPEMVIPVKHHKHLESIQPSDIAEGDCISEALGITLTQLNQLVSRGVVECMSSSQILRDRVFSVKTVSKNLEDVLLKSSCSSGQCDDLLSLQQAAKVAEKFSFDLVDCIGWFQSGKLEFNLLSRDYLLTDIRVNRRKLVACCESEFSHQRDDHLLDRLSVMKVLGVPEEVLDSLGKEGVLPSQRWYGPGVMFELGSVKKFLDRYRVARRESAILGVATGELWNRWCKSGGKTLIDALPGGHIVGIVEFDSLLIDEVA